MSERAYTDEQLPAMASDYRAGMTYREVAAKYGGSDVAARRALHAFGVPARTTVQTRALREGRGVIGDEAELVRMYRNGWKIAPLARHFKVKNQRVSEVLRRHGVHVRPRGQYHEAFDTVAKCEALAAQYRQVQSMNWLAVEHGVSVPTIASALQRAGEKINQPGRAPIWTAEMVERAIFLFEGGLSLDEIADELGTGYRAVRARLREAGCLHIKPGPLSADVDPVGSYVMVLATREDREFVEPTANGYVAEHRLIMGRKLGRPLRADETVHHINGDRGDNHEENLQLRTGPHGAGQARMCADCGSPNIVSVPLAEAAG